MSDTRDLIILGCGPSHVECTYHCETWGVNGVFTLNPKRLDKLFMTDEESEVDATAYDMLRLCEVGRRLGTTLVFPASYKKLSNTGMPIEIFPMAEVFRRFPTRFFSNTIAYELAYALCKTRVIQSPDLMPRVVSGYSRIFFYGIDMMTHSTYVQEKGGVEFWMGVALGMGVQIINTPSSATGKTWNNKMYGWYGKTEDECAKESLQAPWEIVRVSTAVNPQPDWIFDPTKGEFVKTITHPVAGAEVDRSRVKV